MPANKRIIRFVSPLNTESFINTKKKKGIQSNGLNAFSYTPRL